MGRPHNQHRGKIAAGCVFALAVVAIVVFDWRYLSWDNVKQSTADLKGYTEGHYIAATIMFIGLTSLQTASFLPGDTLMPVIGGVLFGTLAGTVYTVVGSTLGATVAFLTARYLLHGWVQDKGGKRVQRLQHGFSRYGLNYLLALRLAPILPSFVVNFGAGVTQIPLRTYVLATVVGILPSTFVYSHASKNLETANSLQDLASPAFFWSLIAVAVVTLIPALWWSLKTKGPPDR
jgi:uncharacterized membrane protein YdjX (TVP38/TMEM64 family)